MRKVTAGVVLSLLSGVAAVAAAQEKTPPAWQAALAPHQGKQATIVVFLGVSCPVANAYLPHLNDLAKKYEPRGVKLVGINANAQDSADDIAKHTKEYALAFPVLKDQGHRLADALAAQRVPEVVLLDAHNKVRYQGRIDDRYQVGGRKDRPGRADLAMALDELLAGKGVTVPRTEVSGCFIGRADNVAAQPVTYCKEIARIIQSRCQSCHRADGVAPFALGTYDQVKANARTIKEVVLERRMPPWHADPRHGKFANDRSMTHTEIDTLVGWIDGGRARGDDKDLPVPVQYPKGKWSIGEPDVVLSMAKEFEVPATGVLPYQDFVIDTAFKEDRWIERAQVLPGSRAVHHAVVFVQGAGEQQWLCAYVPGDSPLVLPPGLAKKVPAGAKLRFNLHYTPTGKVERDRTTVGLVFAKAPPKQPVQQRLLQKQDIQIPPGAAAHREEKIFPVTQDIRVLSFFPHMHVRGKSWECQVRYPDGRTETVLKVPNYDFNWQHTYRYAEPLAVPAGSQIRCIAHYDNSDKNAYNPDPKQTVKWGPQTWDEMMVGLMEFLVDRPAAGAAAIVNPERLEKNVALNFARVLGATAQQLRDAPFAAVLDTAQPCGFKASIAATPIAGLVIPAKDLAAAFKMANKDIAPIGHLWLADLVPVVDGQPAAADQLRLVDIAAAKRTLPLFFLGVRKNAGDQLELCVYAKARDPLLVLPLEEVKSTQELPIEMDLLTDQGTAVGLRFLGRYRARMPVAVKS